MHIRKVRLLVVLLLCVTLAPMAIAKPAPTPSLAPGVDYDVLHDEGDITPVLLPDPNTVVPMLTTIALPVPALSQNTSSL